MFLLHFFLHLLSFPPISFPFPFLSLSLSQNFHFGIFPSFFLPFVLPYLMHFSLYLSLIQEITQKRLLFAHTNHCFPWNLGKSFWVLSQKLLKFKFFAFHPNYSLILCILLFCLLQPPVKLAGYRGSRTMLNQCMPVASRTRSRAMQYMPVGLRTRSRRPQLVKETSNSKKRKTQDECKAKTNMDTAEFSDKDNMPLASQIESDQGLILVEVGNGLQEYPEPEKEPDLKETRKSKKRKTQDERKAKTNVATVESSNKNNMSLASQTESDQGQVILVEEVGTGLQECPEHEKEPDLKETRKSKKRKAQDVPKAKTNIGKSLDKDNMSLASQTESDQGQVILVEEVGTGLQECPEHGKEPDLICPASSDYIDNGDEDDDLMEDFDEVHTSTSGEDNDESEDLDYWVDEEEDPQSSGNSDKISEDDDVYPLVSKPSIHGIARGKAGERRKNSKGLDNGVDEDDSSSDEDVNELRSSKTKPSHKKGQPTSSRQPKLIKILADSILDDEDSGSSTGKEVETEDSSLPLKFSFGVKDTIVPEKSEFDLEMDSLWDEMQFCLKSLRPSKTKSKRKKSKKSKKSKKRRRNSFNQPNLITGISDAVLDIDDSCSSTWKEEETEDNTLPLEFTFGVKDTITPEKSEFEKEIDSLWTEMQFCLTSFEIGSTRTFLEQKEDTHISKVKQNRATLFCQGNHQLILDEEIGMKCKICSFVQLEIRYIAPPFVTQPYEKSERQHSDVDASIFDGLLSQDLNNDMPDCDPCANIKGTVWEIIPDLKNKLYPHQREGFEFMWNNIAGGIYRDKSKNSSDGIGGCIISHAPGTGKTLLTIVFLQTYIKEYPSCRPVIVAPRSMLLTWEAEFRKWKVDIPFHNLNSQDFSGKEKTKGMHLYRKYKLAVPYADRPLAKRLVKLLSWKSDGGILGISYRLFEKLAGKEDKGKQKCNSVDKRVSKILLELPGLFVLDEGHIPRNDESLIWRALSRIKTERRIILSGTPFQNNFDELFNTLCLVRPKFAEKIRSRHQERFDRRDGGKRDEAKRKWAYLTGSIGKDDVYEAEKLREVKAVIKPFVHVHKGTILQTTLPGLRHSLVVLQPSYLQKKILERVKESKNSLNLDYNVSLISIHPSLLLKLLDQKDIKERVSSIVSMHELEKIRLKPYEGVKTKFLIELVKFSQALDEKVIIFSQFLKPLKLIKHQLKACLKWKEGQEILYMHGKCDIKQRQYSMNAFNDPTGKARVLLASTKACSEGINLVGGSRVVLLDVTWNPSVERQAISRAYRLGQKKVVYTYHLISSGSMEGLKCSRQAGKDRLSELLFSSSDKGDHHDKACSPLEDKILEEMIQHEKLKPMFENIINQPKDSELMISFEDL